MLELAKVLEQGCLEGFGGLQGSPVIAAGGFGQHLVNDAQLEQVGASNFEGLSGNRSLAGIPPQDRGTGLGTRNGVNAVFKHQETVGNPNPQGTTGTTFTDHRGKNRHPQAEHLAQVESDRFALALLFRQHTGVGTRGVDKAEDRQAEAIGVIHQPHGLAVAPWGGHAEIAGHVFLGIATLLMAQQHHPLVTDAANPADQGLVIAAATVAMELNPFITDHLDVIQGARALGMARHLNLLGRAQRFKNFGAPAGGQGFQLEQLLAHIHLRIARKLADLLDLLLELNNRLFKLEQGATGHGDRQGGVGKETGLRRKPWQLPGLGPENHAEARPNQSDPSSRE